MGTISEKLTYLNDTKSLLKTVINYANAGIDNNTTFRNYAIKLYDAYIEILKDKYVLLDELPKGTGTGTTISFTNAEDLLVYNLKLDKESTQETTTGKQLFNKETITNNYYYDASGQYVAENNVYISDYIEVDSNTDYTYSTVSTTNRKRINFFDNNKTWLSQVYSDLSSYTFTTPNNTKYIRISFNANIDSKTIQIEKGSTATTYEEYTGRQPSPSPEFPQSVKTVKGYINEKDFTTISYVQGNSATVTRNNGEYTVNAPNQYGNVRFNQSQLNLKPSTTYTFYAKVKETNASGGSCVYVESGLNNINYGIWGNRVTTGNISSVTFTTPATIVSDSNAYIGLYPREANTTATFTDVILVEGNQQLPYVPYGNNYIAVNVSDGTNTNQVPIPLNNNELVGIGTYKDELIVDKSGNVYINKKTGKVVLNGSESWLLYNSTSSRTTFRTNINDIEGYTTGSQTPNILSNRFVPASYNATWKSGQISRLTDNDNQKTVIFVYNSNTTLEDFKTWLSTHNTNVYYVLETPTLININITVDVCLFKGTNNITNSENCNMTIQYVKDISDLIQ